MLLRSYASQHALAALAALLDVRWDDLAGGLEAVALAESLYRIYAYNGR